MPEIDTAHLCWLSVDGSDAQKAAFFQSVKDRSEDTKAADSLLCNSFYDLGQSACELISRVLPVGPLITGRRHGRLEGNFWQEDSTCLSWLDQQPADSVIYPALGPELSRRRFLWVVRPGLSDDDGSSDNASPDGFLDRVGNQSRIVGRSPQQKVLVHPAIACFFTHCGWNSTMEGLSNGVPFLCWPYVRDQFLNKAYITDVWMMGQEVKPKSDGIISREEIESKLEELLGDKEIRASLTIFSQHQFQKLALGPELSGKRFLWAVQPGLSLTDDDGSSDNAYPDGFLDRVGNRGLTLGWSPQQTVLAHPAIACFLTHCGWNSIMEGLSNGVPFLCWPYNLYQFIDKACITDVWKVGLEVKPGTDGSCVWARFLLEGGMHGHGRLEGNFWQVESTCLRWLDQQPADIFHRRRGLWQLNHLQPISISRARTWASTLSEHLTLIDDGSEDAHPDGFIDRAGTCAYPAIACFFTHCGWNSTMEGSTVKQWSSFPLPPYGCDQLLNKANIIDVWKVGWEEKTETDGIISREEMNRKLEDLLGDKEIRARSLELESL
ncbi:hypothetical protein ACLOJK_030486 [Asimina triloba]